MNISLIGMMGSGKTTTGRLLTKVLKNHSFIDTDEEIVKQEKTSINEIFRTKGEAYFRAIETSILHKYLINNNIVISTGGGIINSQENIDLLKNNSTVFYLKSDAETLYERVKNNKERPLLNEGDMKERITTLLSQRACNYEKAHYIIDVTNKTPDDIVKEIAGIINDHSRS